ncbi:AAA family ATPase [Methylobacterium sp. J-001]|uniref:AAA family ATPase n=1 Tax=Methylobacterium sp. J-001 TaxID=2836609 RepID=UPI001FB966DB|nr:AAA family ATPase [Methylobacterium sp. J-001]MCJ2116733.1 AAA family ATPase [Methylobacterium sp. J-001]
MISIAPTAISSEARSPFDSIVDDFVSAGLTEAILPVIPPTADVSEHLAQGRGKIPGCLGDNSWFGFKRWTEHVTTPEDIGRWRTWPGTGLCIRTEVLPALDIDVDDPELAAQIAELAREQIGPGALVRTREGSPRVAILFRTDAPVRKKRLTFTLPDDRGSHAVELLGVGQHLVIAGRHPSGKLYGLEAPGLANRTLADIPSLTQEALDDLLGRVVALVRDAGGRAPQGGQSSTARQAGKPLDPYGAVMRAVVGRRGAWVPNLFNWRPDPTTGPWRITSSELRREDLLQEDLCIYPDGIYDFGTERGHDPISLIREFGSVEGDDEIAFGGSPEYGPSGDHPYAVIGEGDPDVRRPTTAEAIAWLCRYLDGPVAPSGATRETQISCLAAAVGLDWTALRIEHARSAYSLVPYDDAGDPLPEVAPEEWTRSQIADNAPRINAKRALDPKGFDRWRFAWEITDTANDDVLESSLAAEEALARAYLPPEEAPTPPSIDATLPAPTGIRGFELITGIIDARGIPTRRHVIYPRCPCGDLLLTVAEPGTSKSTLALFDALVIASGEERILRGEDLVSPERLHRPGPVIVYDAEDPLDEMRRRLVAGQRAYGLAEMRHGIALWSGVGDEFLRIARRCPDTKALVPADGVVLLMRRIVEIGAVYVALGPLAGLAEGMDENGASDMDAVMTILVRIAAATGVCINVIHHTSKSGGAEAGSMNAGRGSSAIAAKARAMVTLNNLTADQAKLYGVPAQDHIAMTYAKLSHGRKPSGPIIFRRESVLVGNGRGLLDDPRDVFEMSPHAVLQAEGDQAPVLRPVRVGSMPPREATREQRKIVASDGAALALLEVLGGVGRSPLAHILSDVTVRLKEHKLIRGDGRNTVQAFLRTHLGGSGQLVDQGGQNVRVRIEKDGPKHNDPFVVVIEPASDAVGERP